MSAWGGGARRLLIAVSVSVVALSALSIAPAAASPDDPPGRAAAYYAASGAAEREASSPSMSAQSASDADTSKFIAGELVSDAVFFNGSALSQGAIQTLLTAKGANCTTTGAPACLKNATFSTPAKAASTACAALPAQTGISAAQVFANVGSACNINPLVLVTMVQKEQGLVSTAAPTQWMYDHATGWQCPDVGADASCDDTPTSTGFFNQVFGAAWQFQQYGKDPYFNWFPVGKVSDVRLNLDSSCGTKKVAIWNRATAALYYYTPYTPNDASLAAYPGEGDDCSAYGIRNFWMLFNAWADGYSSVTGGTPTVTRAAGADRFDAAVTISQQSYPTPLNGHGNVYIANGLNFPDALGAAPAAAFQGGPLLLVTPDSIPASVAAELQRLKPGGIVVVGGVNSVSDAVLAQLAQYGPAGRLSGDDRYAAARSLVSAVWPGTVTRLFIATGANFPDALSAGAAAGTLSVPVLLVNGSAATLDDPTVALIQRLHPGEIDIVGGPNSVSTTIEGQLGTLAGTVHRYSGDDRFAVSASLNGDTSIFPTVPSVYFANGFTFPDALAGAASAAKAHSPLYVSQAGCVTTAAAQAALKPSSTAIRLLGGTASIGAGVGKLTVCS